MINIRDIFEKYNIELDEKMVENFNNYYYLLIEYNKVMNLTAITEFDEVVVKHFLDSVLPHYLIKRNSTVVDVGTGAGFPSIPLKIVRPDLNFVLVDSLNKRINFLNEVIKQLNLTNIEALHFRAEDFAFNNMYREKFDYCVSRAVAKLNTLSELCVPLLKVEGKMIAYKGSNWKDEVDISKNALKLLNCKIEKIENYDLPLEFGERSVIVIKKISRTSKLYPRKNNAPKIKPL